MLIDHHESLQLALFLRGSANLSALELWALGIGNAPLGFQTNPQQPTITQAQGKVDTHDLTLVTQPGRIDLHFTGSLLAGKQPAIPDFDGAVAAGIAAVEKIVDRIEVGRTAVVAQGWASAADTKAASQGVAKFVPGLPVPAGSEDVAYSLIVRKPSQAVPTRTIGQICRWSAVGMQYVQIGPGLPPNTGALEWVSHAHIDVFGDGMMILDSAAAVAELKEVSARATELLRGGAHAL